MTPSSIVSDIKNAGVHAAQAFSLPISRRSTTSGEDVPMKQAVARPARALGRATAWRHQVRIDSSISSSNGVER